LIIDIRPAAKVSLTKDQRHTMRQAVVDWPPIARVHEAFDKYVGDVLRVQNGNRESLGAACLKNGLDAYRENLAAPDQARLVAFLRAFLGAASNWLAGIHVESDEGTKWMVGHAEPLRAWLKSRSGAKIVESAAADDGVCNTLFHRVTPPRLIERLEMRKSN
jgi:hypothetical protein